MFLATISKPKRLLYLSYLEHVRSDELVDGLSEVGLLLADLDEGFRLLTDLSGLESMGVECAGPIGKIMELCEARGVRLVVRVIPDPKKDIGLTILSQFHYRRHPKMITCRTLAEAAKALSG